MEVAHIVKRQGHKEPFDEKKVYASVYSACLNAHLNKEQSEKIAEKIMWEINSWISNRDEVNSNEIFRKIIELLKTHNPDASFMYETHRDVS
ncbi:hypothetical protein C4553_03645 [Candidatus Parcubacteria bacterium]|nr:MAG: hypothetical protein C4553_03645 [Candidatus Parcubacteria bacterium]